MNMQDNNLKQMLTEVRASYRLLHDFQRRVIDLVSYIGKKYGMDYYKGFQKFSNSPRKGTLKLSAWDWLSMYFYEFHFQDKVVNDKTICFSIFLLADNGYYKLRSEGNLNQTSTYADVKESETELIFVAGNCWDWQRYFPDWKNDEFLFEKSYKGDDGTGEIMYQKHYNLEDFESEEDAMKNIADFANECKKLGIPLDIVTTKI